jgi:Na+/H+ antiporter NhaD/arsenite permease-like protein
MNVGLTLFCFTLTYAGLALGKLPSLRTDRAGIALVGATLTLATGILGFDDAVKSIDFATIALLLGMMIVVGFLHRASFFAWLAQWMLNQVESPHGLLAMSMLLSGGLSALLVNDVVCLALTPLVLNLARSQNLDPRPHLIGLALASNIGSVATLTGNPQNMMIGGFSQIGYLRFAEKLAPIAVIGLILAYVVTAWIFKSTLRHALPTLEEKQRHAQANPESNGKVQRGMHRSQRLLLYKSLTVTVGAVILFFAGAPMALVALGAASILLLGRTNPRKVYEQVNWGLLVMFAGLFVVVHAFEVHVLSQCGINEWTILHDNPIGLLSIISAILSNIVSNVPAVLLFKPIVLTMPAEVQETAWLALAMSSTLAGNLTILGSVANLIVVEGARREGVNVSFGDYVRVGAPVTLLTLIVGVVWLRFVPY